jgi:hypothetical protein
LEQDDLLSAWLAQAPVLSDAAVPVVDRSLPMMASYSQQGLWMADAVSAETDKSSVVQHSWRITGTFNIDALQRALNCLMVRHEVFRIGFLEQDGTLLQKVFMHSDLDFETEEVAPHVLNDRIKSIYRKPLDLSAGKVMRSRLFRLGIRDHVLLITIHHIAFDGWSFDILQRELQDLYSAALYAPGLAGAELLNAADLAPLPVQYADCAVWQRSRVDEGKCAEAVAYWKRYLAGAPDVLKFPIDRPRTACRSSAGSRISFPLPDDVNEKVKSCSARLLTTPFCVQLAALGLTMAKWSGQQDFLLGITLAARKHPETESLIGLFVNVLPIRFIIDRREMPSDLIARLNRDLLNMHDHDEVPLEYLLGALGVARVPSLRPLIQMTVASHQNLARQLELEGVGVTYMPPTDLDVDEDLSVFLTSSGDGIDAHFAFNADLFEQQTIRTRADDFVAILRSISVASSSSIDQLVYVGQSVARAIPEDHLVATPESNLESANTEIENVMLGIWREVFPTVNIDRESSFFAVGGTSLAAVRVCGRATTAFGVRLPVRKLFQHSTLKALSAVVEDLLEVEKA